ncbi:MAG: XRE family transcriptional regulator [Actinobacteria bacterium]|nr:XRE family transcriptional regulator [Actinomycetota bacterium]
MSETPREPAAPTGGRVGDEVRTRRLAAGLSIAELARRADVSAAFISQLEAGRSSISIATMYRVAHALSCSANSLLGASEPRPHVTRAGTGPRLAAGAGEHSQDPRLLSRTGDDVMLEAYHYVIAPDDDEQEWFQHEGEDFVYVISGHISIVFDDGTRVELSTGDSMHHAGTVGHRWLLLGDEAAEVMCIVGSPPATTPARPPGN